MTTPKRDIPQLPGGPDPKQPVPRTPVDGFDLVAFAAISAHLAAGREPRAAVLSRAALNEPRWLAIEHTWMLRIAAALLAGDRSLHDAYDAAFSEAQRSLAVGAPERSLEEYASIVAALEAGREPATVLAAAGLSIGAFTRLQRAWTERLAADPELAAHFRAVLDARRAGAP